MISFDNAKAILKPFLFSPTKPKYIREIEKDCELSYERVQYYLNELEKNTVVRSAIRGKIKEYSININNELVLKLFSVLEMERRHEFYRDSKTAVVWLRRMTNELLSEDSNKKSKTNIKFILLFGSAARMDTNEESDFDILIVVKNKDRYFESHTGSIGKQMENLSGKKFSIQTIELDMMRKLWKNEPVYHNIWIDRILLYGEEKFWMEVLKIGEPI